MEKQHQKCCDPGFDDKEIKCLSQGEYYIMLRHFCKDLGLQYQLTKEFNKYG